MIYYKEPVAYSEVAGEELPVYESPASCSYDEHENDEYWVGEGSK